MTSIQGRQNNLIDAAAMQSHLVHSAAMHAGTGCWPTPRTCTTNGKIILIDQRRMESSKSFESSIGYQSMTKQNSC